MNWSELLTGEIESAYRATEGLLALVDENGLDWKPATGDNWMTCGQLLKHISNACGAPMRGFVTGDWGLPEGVDPSQFTPEQMMPPAEQMLSLGSVAEARRLLAEDKQTALAMVAKCQAEGRYGDPAPAPWDPTPMSLGERMLEMVAHLSSHKSQLFYYLKLQGKPVNTMHLWGMG